MINNIEKQFAEDIKNGKDPTLNTCDQYRAMESGQVTLDELLVKGTLQKDPNEYPKNRVQRVVGTELQASQGDTIKYYKSDMAAGGGTSNPNLLSLRKYLEMLRTTVEDSLEVMGYDFDFDVVGKKTSTKRDKPEEQPRFVIDQLIKFFRNIPISNK